MKMIGFLASFLLLAGWTQTMGQEFLTEPQNLEVIRGESATINCSVKNLGGFSVVWLRERAVLTANLIVINTNRPIRIKGRYNLFIENTTLEDEGTYACQVSSNPIMVQKSALIVTIPPTIKMLSHTREIKAELGDNVTLRCSADGKPKPSITWKREGSILPVGAVASEGGVLTLTSLQRTYQGRYSCHADNGVGQPAEDQVLLSIYYPPFVAVPSNKIYTGPGERVNLPCVISAYPQAKITWSFYNITFESNAMDIVKEQREFDESSTLVLSIVRDTDFGKYTCMAHNELGTGEQYIELTGVPQKVEITSSKAGKFSEVYNLSWKVRSFSAPEYYRLLLMKVNSSQGTDWQTVSIKADAKAGPTEHFQSFDLTGLDPDTMYKVKIQAENIYGWGDINDPFQFGTNKDGYFPPITTTPDPNSETEQAQIVYTGDDSDISGSGYLGASTSVFIAMVMTFLSIL